jgi:hypothetical protein
VNGTTASVASEICAKSASENVFYVMGSTAEGAFIWNHILVGSAVNQRAKFQKLKRKNYLNAFSAMMLLNAKSKRTKKKCSGIALNVNTTTKSTVTIFARVASSRVSSATKKCVKIA